MTLDLDPERRLALAYVPLDRRPAVEALWRLDVTLGSVLATGREPMINRIRLAWWREALERLDREPPPAEPILEAVARHLLPAGLGGAELSAMEEGWAALVEPGQLGQEALETHARLRGGLLFAFSARLLGGGGEKLVEAGESWALIDLARRVSSAAERATASHAALAREGSGYWPRSLRPLGMLAVLARRDAERAPRWEKQGAPGRVLRMIGHRLTGR